MQQTKQTKTKSNLKLCPTLTNFNVIRASFVKSARNNANKIGFSCQEDIGQIMHTAIEDS